MNMKTKNQNHLSTHTSTDQLPGYLKTRDGEVTPDVVRHNIKENQKIYFTADDVDISEVAALMQQITGDDGLIHPVTYDEVKDAAPMDIQMVLHLMGLYTFPTQEVIDWLRNEVDDDPDLYPDAIEICAGSGWIGRALEIPITDSKMQAREDVKALYASIKQPTITYPDDVEQLDAVAAITKYQPEYVIGSYVTHKWDRHSRKVGNMYGVDTAWVVNHCRKYYHLGNLNTHKYDPIMARPHKEYSFPWLLSRGNADLARIFVWEQRQYQSSFWPF